ncbi:MAG: amidohydrolase family protein [Candidatus Krumholzibacteriia bacterium]
MSIPLVFDAHIHLQPWHMLRPEVRERMWHGRASRDTVLAMARDPERLLRFLDGEGIERAVLVNYVSPNVMGFTEETNDWIAAYVRGHESRLYAMGSVHPRHTRDARADVERLADKGIRALKLHPPHQLVSPNAYLDGLEPQAALYRAAEDVGLPLMVHTGTSIFPGARNRYADPMPVDDVACDFPDLRIVLAHGGRPLHMDTSVFLVRRHPNVWMDVSGIPPKALLDYFPKLESIAHKVLWGTDWPAPGVPAPSRNVEQFWALPLAEANKRRILRENALAFFAGRRAGSGEHGEGGA